MIELTEVTKGIGSFYLENISLQLPEGAIMGLVGANGSGKTTLIQILLGLYRTDSGSVRIDGQEYADAERSIREEIGYVLQDELFQGGLSSYENADYYGRYYQRYDKELLREFLEEFNVNGRCKVKALSKGEKLKLQFAFALSCKPKYLIMDEPAGNFDPEFAELFYQKLAAFVSDGQHSILLSTHQTEGLERIADYITFLEKGKLVFSEDVESLREHYKIISGEKYKIKLLPEERVIYIEENAYGAKALAVNSRIHPFDSELLVEDASIEEMMYFITEGGRA